MIGLSILLAKGRTLFVADTSIHELPDAEELAEIAIQAAATVRKLGRTPRVAFLSATPPSATRRATAARRCARRSASSTRAASTSNTRARCRPNWRSIPTPRANYPFMRLTGHANVLVMPAIHSAAISTRLVQAAGRRDRDRSAAGRAGEVGPDRPRSAPRSAEIITAATFAAYDEGAVA